MYFKLAFRNVRRSVRDYAVYFLTLSFGVCIFYIFNSIASQQAMLSISEQQHAILDALIEMMNYTSIFVSIILGFLILYANAFLIKRRKNELGVYMTLGMNKNTMSLILMLETLIIGCASLLIGLIAGIFLSQGLAVLTAKLFESDFVAFTFIFSGSAALKTLCYFGLIFVIVMFFNTFSISRIKLIDLIQAKHTNQKLKIRNLRVSVLLFVVSILCLLLSYKLIIENGLLNIGPQFAASLILGSVGTFLFFMSLSGFLLRVIQSSQRLYLKNLNLFVLRQLNSKINTTFMSMTIICIMLLVTIGTLSSSIGLAKTLTGELDSSTPYDATVSSSDIARMPDTLLEENPFAALPIGEQLTAYGIDLSEITEKSNTTTYYLDPTLTLSSVLAGDNAKIKEYFTNDLSFYDVFINQRLPIITLSDYNDHLQMQGDTPITLSSDHFLIDSNVALMEPSISEFLAQDPALSINGTSLKTSEEIIRTPLMTSPSTVTYAVIIVPDALVAGLPVFSTQLDILYKEPAAASETAFSAAMDLLPQNSGITEYSKIAIYDQGAALKITISYIGIYVGIIFLISSAAVLALQQLSEASDNIERYRLLQKIGAEETMIKHALFIQIAIYFAMPLLLALVHSVVGLSVANRFIELFGHVDVATSSLWTALFILLIYGLYFLATYLNSFGMIKSK